MNKLKTEYVDKLEDVDKLTKIVEKLSSAIKDQKETKPADKKTDKLPKIYETDEKTNKKD
jgi:hypothetical protein